jgi:dipeptidyl-peptidase-4
MKITLLLIFVFVLSAAVSTGDLPESSANAQAPDGSAKAKQRTGNQQNAKQKITLAMLDGPDRILKDLPKSPRWFGDKNWLRIADDDTETLVDALTGEPVDIPAKPYQQKNVSDALVDAGLQVELAEKIAASKPLIPTTNAVAIFEKTGYSVVYWTQGNGTTKDSVSILGDPENNAELFTFNRDESQVAFVTAKGFHVFDLNAKSTKSLLADDPKHLLGKFDWVYQEELYGRGNFKGFWWQPTGDQIAFLKLDESPLVPFTVMDHLPVHGESEKTNYPKAGDPNPIVEVGVLSSGDPQVVHWVDLSKYKDDQILVSGVSWSEDGSQLLLQVQNREQTWLDLVATDANGKNPKTLFRDKTPAWIESPGDPVLLDGGDFIWRSPRTGYSHLYRYDKNGQLLGEITSGEWEVRSLVGVDKDRQYVYFTATKDTPLEVHGYRANLKDGSIERLTEPGFFHSLTFSDDLSLFIDNASSISSLPSYSLKKSDGTQVRTFGDAADRLDNLDIVKPEFLTIASENEQPLDAVIFKPADFDPQKKYPVLVHIYAGPQAPRVLNRFRGVQYLWHQMLAQQGYIVWMCDNQSASYRSVKNAWPIHRDMAKNELADIEKGVDWLKSQDWVDVDRIGIWGWSYGGYMTAYALTNSESFKMGISGAPVTDWKNYDSIYTERYMGLPQENKTGYESSSVLYNKAKDLHGELLLIHGTIDDNVHLNNSLQFMKQLQYAGKQFEVMFYPSNRHSVSDKKQAGHLRKLMTDFVLENL